MIFKCANVLWECQIPLLLDFTKEGVLFFQCAPERQLVKKLMINFGKAYLSMS